ncbi:MAG TPA: ACT domain-containing protein [archaeon]|nr:ACT domain-containing protein [archaeon]
MAKNSFIVVAAVGKDRPGLIAGLSSAVASINGNIEDMDEVVLRNSVFVMSMVVDISLTKKNFNEVKGILATKGQRLGLKVLVDRVDL